MKGASKMDKNLQRLKDEIDNHSVNKLIDDLLTISMDKEDIRWLLAFISTLANKIQKDISLK